DGTQRWVRSRAFRAPSATGRLEQVVGVVEDVTELKRAEEQAAHSQKMEAVARLAGGVAHDFNNLLTVILSWTDVIRDEISLDESVRESLHEITRAGEAAAGLTRQLLSFSRKQLITPSVFKVNDAVDGMGRMMRRVIGENIELRVRLDRESANVRADRG